MTLLLITGSRVTITELLLKSVTLPVLFETTTAIASQSILFCLQLHGDGNQDLSAALLPYS